MTTTLIQLRQQTCLLAGVSYDPDNATVSTPGGVTTLITFDQALNLWINEAQSDLTKTCIPVWDTGTATVTAGQRFVSFPSLATVGGGTLWTVGANAVSFGGVPLTRATPYVADRDYPSRPSDPNGAPVYWSAQGAQGLRVSPKPAATGTLSVFGLVVPKYLSADTDTVPWIDDPSVWLLCEWAAMRLCENRASDTTLGPMAALHQEKYREGQKARLDQLSDEERDLLISAAEGSATPAGAV